MSFAAVLLTPFVLLFPAAGTVEARELYDAPMVVAGQTASDAGDGETEPGWSFREVAESFRAQVQRQVRIEQHMTIRITPSRPMTMPPPNFLFDFRQRELGTRFVERSMGRCVSVAGISGVQPSAGNRLILFMRDRRMVSATLERACSARDFYSGFYLDRTNDGQLCVDRDTLLSRSGANCKLTSIRQLIDISD